MTGDCFSCRRWQRCQGKDWYSFGEIRWCPYQILWILKNCVMLSAGYWPKQPKPDSPKRRGKPKAEGYFVKAELVIGEVRVRMASTDGDGEALNDEAMAGADILSLSDGAYNALLYLKGKDRKSEPYYEWDRQRTRRLIEKGVQL